MSFAVGLVALSWYVLCVSNLYLHLAHSRASYEQPMNHTSDGHESRSGGSDAIVIV